MPESKPSLSPEEQGYLLGRARRSIERVLGATTTPETPAPPSNRLEMSYGGFITLKIRGRLRGCIGTIEERGPLPQMVDEMARAAAFEDPRFPGLKTDELPDLDIEISVLSPLEPISGPADVEVGRHGLVVEQGIQRGLLLPQVAAEQQWDAVTFLEHTSMKAGLKADAWKDEETRLYTFTAHIFGEDGSAR